MRHIYLRFCEGIVSHFFGVIGSPQCKSLKTLEFEACRASIVSESCLTDPTITKFLREQNNADEPLFTSRAVKAVL